MVTPLSLYLHLNEFFKIKLIYTWNFFLFLNFEVDSTFCFFPLFLVNENLGSDIPGETNDTLLINLAS